jgi:arginase
MGTTSLEALRGSLRGSFETLSVPFHVGDPVPGFPTPPDAAVLAPELPEGSPQTKMVAIFRQIAERVEKSDGCLVYAGDCMAPLGVLAGLQRRGVSPFLVWFDAHGDFNTWETTPSGYIGGMPIAMLVGRGEQTIVEGVGLEPMDEGRIVIADARDVDADEGVALKGSRPGAARAAETAERLVASLVGAGP